MLIKKITLSVLGTTILFVLLSNGLKKDTIKITDETTVWEIYAKLGKIELHKVNTKVKGYSAERGKELVHQGYTTAPNGKRTKIQSKFFKCTSCHNTVKEFDTMTDNDPQNRLDYAVKNDIPFLQGSTFFGIVNRKSFYNGDYQKKYASVPDIVASYRDIRKAIHVCATQCAQGRELEDWEMESVLAYFWELQLKIGDLEITDVEKEKIEYALNEERSSARAIHILEDKFLENSPATFPKKALEPIVLTEGDLKNKKSFNNGKAIYDLSCKYCHEGKKYSLYNLSDSRGTFKHLSNKAMKADSYHSIYYITREGTHPVPGKKAYMPQYTLEKMNDQQLKDLHIYIQAMAEGIGAE
ncbi:MAG: cytochrome c [Saprospiraceae bacterium]|nr:cytochrome c [Saprospiraceae bacterium]